MPYATQHVNRPAEVALRAEGDPHLRRPDPDTLPKLRRCKCCGNTLPLNAVYFAENRQRYPWALSRFHSRCRACDRLKARESSRNNRERINARRRTLRRQRRELSSIGAEPVLYRLNAAREASPEKTRKAMMKRRVLRVNGPAPDWVKRKIAETIKVANKKAAERWRDAGRRALEGLRSPPSKTDYPERLEELRRIHREAAKR